jgi:hypothetical protein
VPNLPDLTASSTVDRAIGNRGLHCDGPTVLYFDLVTNRFPPAVLP